MSASVRVSPQAEGQITAIDDWWRSNREAAPELFTQELAEAISLLEAAPEIGRRTAHPFVLGLRRILLRACRYHLYYIYDRATITVSILAVWSQVRDSMPRLTR